MIVSESLKNSASLNFIIDRDQFLHSLAYINNITERRNNVAVLSCVKIEVQNNKLKLTATDLNLSIVSSLDANILSPGKVVVSAQLLYDIVKKLPNNVSIEFSITNNGKLYIVCNDVHFSLPVTNVERFPLIENHHLECEFKLKALDLLLLFSKTKFAISPEGTYEHLEGVYFHIYENKLCCAATDNHRLAVIKIPKPDNIYNDFALTIPKKAVIEILRIISSASSEDYISISLSPRKICFLYKNYLIISKLLETSFPDYNSIIPQNHDKFMVVDSCLLSQTVDRVSVIIMDKVKSVKFTLSSNKLTLSAISSNQSDSMESLVVDYNDENLEIGFNARYLIDIFSCIKEKCQFAFFDKNTGVIIKDLEMENAIYLIMPMCI